MCSHGVKIQQMQGNVVCSGLFAQHGHSPGLSLVAFRCFSPRFRFDFHFNFASLRFSFKSRAVWFVSRASGSVCSEQMAQPGSGNVH